MYPLVNVYKKLRKITTFKFGKSTISMGHLFNSKLLNYQAGYIYI